MHPPSRRRDTARPRDRSLPRSSDKLKQDLLSLITEPAQNRLVQKSPNDRNLNSSKTDSTDDDLSPRKFNHEHLTEADRQFTPMTPVANSVQNSAPIINSQTAKSVQIQKRDKRTKSASDPITDERLHRIEKTLREMQIKLDEVIITAGGQI